MHSSRAATLPSARRTGSRDVVTGARREERGAQGVPSASLLRLNRHLVPNVFVVGGDPSDRVAIVRALHRHSPIAAGPFCALASGGDATLLERALVSWLGHAEVPEPLACERGTLFIDDIAALPFTVQRLLDRWSRRVEGVPAAERRGRGPARLAAGSAIDPSEEVARGRLLPDLFDSLEKLSIHLGPAPRAVARRLAPVVRAVVPSMPPTSFVAIP